MAYGQRTRVRGDRVDEIEREHFRLVRDAGALEELGQEVGDETIAGELSEGACATIFSL